MIAAASSSRSTGHAQIVASRLGPAVATQTLSLLPTGGQDLCHCFLLVEGEATVSLADGNAIELGAPALIWVPAGLGRQIRLSAGGIAMAAAASETFVWRTTGDGAMAIDFRPLLREVAIASGGSFPLKDAIVWFESMEQELRAAEAGAASLVAFAFGAILVHLWRAIGSLQRQASSSGGREGLAQRYQQLVELHLRDRMSIEAYAAQLGVTRDRLTEACNHVVGMPPQAILHARLVDEARHRLQHSAVSIEQVSYSLGFRDPAYFNRFFTRMTGATPGAFRKAARNARPAEANSFAAWP